MANLVPDIGSSKISRAPSSEDIKRPKLGMRELDEQATEGKQDSVGGWRGVLSFLEKKGDVEVRGCTPVPYEDRTETSYSKIFTLWFCMSCNPLPVTFGMVGTKSFALSLRDAALVILFFTLVSTVPVAYMCTWGPKTGMRQLVQARFSFGKYFVSLLILLNLATLTGFCVVDSVIGGMALSAVQDGTSINATVGIVIIAILSLFISFCGFRVLHVYERWAWIPALVALVIAAGCGGKSLTHQVVAPAATAPQILSFGGLVASFMLPWAALASDFSTYMHPKAPSFRIALYAYVGLALPTILLMILGAAMGGATPNMASWQAGYDVNAASGVLAAMLHPAGGFGRFVTVVLAFSMLGNLSATMYSVTLNLQMLVPWLFRIPASCSASSSPASSLASPSKHPSPSSSTSKTSSASSGTGAPPSSASPSRSTWFSDAAASWPIPRMKTRGMTQPSSRLEWRLLARFCSLLASSFPVWHRCGGRDPSRKLRVT
ncbi:hypothetical protein P3342_009800 [Pyrenophora teres f. teres]|nr:hypothetical protein P3342_009800 [Pyrenophora teres f. teres]